MVVTHYCTTLLAQVDIAKTGREAVNKLEKAPDQYDIVLMDLMMPEMNGVEASAYIRGQLKLTLPIICLTGSVTFSDRQRALEVCRLVFSYMCTLTDKLLVLFAFLSRLV